METMETIKSIDTIKSMDTKKFQETNTTKEKIIYIYFIMSSYFNSSRNSYNTRPSNSSSYLDSLRKTFSSVAPNGFHKNLIIVALIVLVIVLLYFAYSIVNNEKHKTWPPLTPPCPDYWEMNNDSSGNNTCKNIQNLG